MIFPAARCNVAVSEPEPARPDRLGNDLPAIRAVLNPQALSADRPHVAGRVSHSGKIPTLLAAVADKHRRPLRLRTPSDPSHGAHPVPVQAMPRDRLAVRHSRHMEQLSLARHHPKAGAARTPLTRPLPVTLQHPAHRGQPRAPGRNPRRHSEHFFRASPCVCALDPANGATPTAQLQVISNTTTRPEPAPA